MLCGGIFGLPIHRHRYFEINPELPLILTQQCSIPQKTIYVTGTPRPKDGSPRKDASKEEKVRAMEIDWMTTKELDEAIPPAYTEFIGKQIMRVLKEFPCTF